MSESGVGPSASVFVVSAPRRLAARFAAVPPLLVRLAGEEEGPAETGVIGCATMMNYKKKRNWIAFVIDVAHKHGHTLTQQPKIPFLSMAGDVLNKETSSHWISSHALPSSLVVPPIPHPHPFRELSLCVTEGGIVIRSTSTNDGTAQMYARVTWGLKSSVERVSAQTIYPKPDWTITLQVYGVVGVIKLFRSQSKPTRPYNKFLHAFQFFSFLPLGNHLAL
jgi:hypothetical protein